MKQPAPSALLKRWRVLERFVKLPALQRGTLIRRRLPVWLRPRGDTKLVSTTRSTGGPRAMAGARPLAVTCIPHPTTGSGHRFSEWNSGFTVARKLSLPFLSAGLGQGWDEALGLAGKFEDAASFLKKHRARVVRLPLVEWHNRPEAVDELCDLVIAAGRQCPGAVVMLGDGQNLYRQHDSMEALQPLYRAANYDRPRAWLTIKKKLRVAVHVRRGDVAVMKTQGHGDWAGRYVEVSWFHRALAATISGLEDEPCDIEVFSQGSPDEFACLKTFPSLTFCLDADPVWTFHRMATADVLIVSPSSFSFNAGLFNPGIKIARTPWWHDIPDVGGWCGVKDVEADFSRIGNFVRETIKRRILT